MIGPNKSENVLYASSSVAKIPMAPWFWTPDLTQHFMLPPLVVAFFFKLAQISLLRYFLINPLYSSSNFGY